MAVKKVVYYQHPEVGNYHYGRFHPMKPQRLNACNSLICSYGLDKKLMVVESPRLTYEEMTNFHSREYIDFLRKISPNSAEAMESQFASFNFGEDCPVFEGIYDYCTIYAGGSVEGAKRLNHEYNDIVINWPGGLHHAKKNKASGFCYVNDIVLGILELLKYHKRVLYIDIDIHHGDGVQEAFNNSDRVMTASFHRFGGTFFPGTGNILDKGFDQGKYFAINVPFFSGVGDEDYHSVFQPVISAIMQNFDPEAVVLQCGADSLGEDRIGCFNLSFDGHARCVEYVKSFKRRMLVVGGGGYTLRNVARCWANETAVCLGLDIPDKIPDSSEYYQFFAPNFTLRPTLKVKVPNENTKEYLAMIRNELLETLAMVKGAPSVQFYNPPGSRLEEIEILEDNDKRSAGDFEDVMPERTEQLRPHGRGGKRGSRGVRGAHKAIRD